MAICIANVEANTLEVVRSLLVLFAPDILNEVFVVISTHIHIAPLPLVIIDISKPSMLKFILATEKYVCHKL